MHCIRIVKRKKKSRVIKPRQIHSLCSVQRGDTRFTPPPRGEPHGATVEFNSTLPKASQEERKAFAAVLCSSLDGEMLYSSSNTGAILKNYTSPTNVFITSSSSRDSGCTCINLEIAKTENADNKWAKKKKCMSVFDFGWFEKAWFSKIQWKHNENTMKTQCHTISHDVHKYSHGLPQYLWTEKETE